MSKRFFLPVLTAILVSSLTLTAQDIPVVNIENPVVQLFMSKGPYEAFGSQESYFANTVDFPVRYAQDKPAGFLLNWEGNDNAQYTLTLKVSEGSSQKTVFKEKIQGTSYVLTNLYPQKTYSYSVKKGMKTILKGSFRTEGQVRMLDIEDSCNARDLGGWTGLDGRKIRYGLLFRTASIDGAYDGVHGENCGNNRCRDPHHQEAQGQVGDPARYTLSQQSLKELKQIGIKADLDMRGLTGEGMWGNQCMTHTRSLGLTKIPGADYFQLVNDYALHNPFDDPAMVRDVAWIIQELRKGRPVAFHCRSGADRTGALAMLIEALLGVSGGDIALDYELTSLSSEGTGQTRSAKNVLTSGYGFYGRGFTTLEVDTSDPAKVLHKQAFKYLTMSFPEYAIPAADLEWFIGFMLE